jgi:type II secretory pathway pseudopilin PulG
MTMKRRAFSLLEVILAIGILAGAVAVLGELARLALRNAQLARDTSRAQLFCEYQLNEILAGIAEPTSAGPSPCDVPCDPGEPAWTYQVVVGNTSSTVEGLLSIQVTVTQDLPPEQHPVQVSLARWMLDPNFDASQTSSDDSSSSDSSSTGM